MANQEKINELVSEEAFASLDKLRKSLEAANDVMVKSLLTAKQLADALAKTGSLKDLTAAQKNYQDALNKTALAEEKVTQLKLKNQLVEEKITQAKAKTTADAEKQEARKAAIEQKEIDRENARIVREAKKGKSIISNSQLEIDAYNNTVDGNKKVTSTLNAANIAQARAASSATALTSAQENAAEASQEMTVSTLRVAPAAIAAQRSIRSLQIQLESYRAIAETTSDPVIRSDFNRRIEDTTAEIDRLRNVGRAGFDEFGNAVERSSSRIGKLWQGLKTVANLLPGIGIAGLLAFAAGPIIEWIQNLEIIKGTAKDIAQETAFASDSYKDAVKDVTTLRVAMGEFHSGIITGTQLVKIYNQGIGQTAGELKTAAEVEAFYNSKADDYVHAMFLRSKASAALQKAIEDQTKAEERAAKGPTFLDYTAASLAKLPEVVGGTLKDTFNLLVNPFSVKRNGLTGAIDEIYSLAGKAQKQGVRDLQKDAKTSADLFKELQIEADKFAKKSGLDLSGNDKSGGKVDTALFDADKARVERTKDAAKEITDNENEALDARLQALEIYVNASEELTRINYDREVKKAKGNKDQLLFLQQQLITDREKVLIDGRKLEQKINEDAEKELAKLLKDGLKDYEEAEKKKIEAMQVSIKQQQELLSAYADSALLGTAEQYAEGILNEKEYAKARLEIQRQYVLDSINEDIKGVQSIIDAKKAAGLDTASDEKALADLKKKLSKETTDQQIEDLEKLAAKEKELNDKKKELAFEVAELGISIVNGVFDNQKNKIQEEMDLTEQKAQKDIENVNNSLLTEQEKADRIAIIEAQSAAKKKVLEQEQRAIDQKRARFEKAVSIAKIIANTAVGITSALAMTPPNVPLSILIGAIGAVQVGQVLATPIPAFKDGKKKGNNYSGAAWVGDGFEHELRIEPNGNMSWTPNTPTLTTVSAGTQIIGGDDVRRMMSKPPELRPSIAANSGFDVSNLIISQENNTKKIIKAFTNQKSNNTIITKSGWRNTQSKMNGIDSYLKRNFN